MKRTKPASALRRSAIKLAEEELRVGAKILEYEMGDIWGHVGVRLPDDEGIAVQTSTPPSIPTRRCASRLASPTSRFPACKCSPTASAAAYPSIRNRYIS